MTEQTSGQEPKGPGEMSGRRAAPDRPRGSLIDDLLQILQSRVAQLTLNFLIGVGAARIWGAEAVGIMALSLVIPGLVGDALDLGTRKSLPYLIGKRESPIEDIMGAALMMWLIISVVSTAIAIGVLATPVMPNVPPLWGVLGALTIAPLIFGNYGRSFAMGVQRLSFFKHQVWSREPITLAIILIGGPLLGFVDPKYGWIRILAAIVGFSLAAWLSVRMMRQYVRLRFTWNYRLMRTFLSQSFMFGLGVWLMRLNCQVGLVLLGLATFALPAQQIGNYSRAATVAMLLWQVPGMLSLVLYTRGVSAKNQAYASYRAALIARVSTIAALPFAGALFFAAPYLMPLVYGRDFRDSGTIVQILIPGIVAFFGARAYEADISAKGRPLLLVAVMGPLAVLNVILNFVFIPHMGANGAALASSICFMCGTIALGFVFGKVAGIPVANVFLPRVSDFRFVTERILAFVKTSLGRRRAADAPKPIPADEGEADELDPSNPAS